MQFISTSSNFFQIFQCIGYEIEEEVAKIYFIYENTLGGCAVGSLNMKAYAMA